MRFILLVLGGLFTGIASELSAQSFANGSLNGTVGISNTPTSWAQVPDTDPVSQATMNLSATSDVTSTTGPLSGNINGNPYHGTTLVSGLHMYNGGDIWHEGIQQTLTGLSVGQAYTISFYQNVIKQSNATDNTGSWAVYRESSLIGISAVSTDLSAVGSNTHPWHRRTVTFTATSTSHLIKFLPWDDDANIVSPAGVRMGIDSVTLSLATVLPTAFDFSVSLLGDQQVELNWEDASNGVSGYVVEHSPDGVSFEPAGQVERNDQGSYRFVDDRPFIESHYRIAQISENGDLNYSSVQHIRTQAELGAEIRSRRLSISGGYGRDYAVTMLDLQGREVFAENVSSEADFSLLNGGIYFLRIVSQGKEREILEKRILLE